MAWACQPLDVGESHFAARLLRELLFEAILESQQQLLLACVLAMFSVLLSSHQPIESEASAKVFLATALAGIMAAVPVSGFCAGGAGTTSKFIYEVHPSRIHKVPQILKLAGTRKPGLAFIAQAC